MQPTEYRRSAVAIPTGPLKIHGDLVLPNAANAIVLFAHGSGSSRHSPRNRFVARILQEGGIATLLMDLLTKEEEAADAETGRWRFDVEMLAERLIGATEWIRERLGADGPPKVGYFGASTGAAAALIAATQVKSNIGALVARGGRPDMAGGSLRDVEAPALLIVGGADEVVLELNRKAFDRLRSPKELRIIPGATHLFEEPGALEEVVQLSRDWFLRYL